MVPPRAARGLLVLLPLALACPSGPPSDYYEVPPPRKRMVPPPTTPPPATPDAAQVPTPEPPAPVPPPDASDDDAGARVPSFVGLFKRLSPSVVNIYTQEVVRERLWEPWLPLPLPRDRTRGTSLGSGLVLDVHGHILTNSHVVENAAEIRVRFHDGSEIPARLRGIDPVRDLALVKVDGARDLLPVVPALREPEVGDWVLAIGNPFGLSHTLTKGIVSGTGRSEFISPDMGYVDLIQTDAAINHGNSGGPLFNLAGRVVGVAAAVSAEGQGISFAIPWRTVEDALPRLMQGGQVSRSWLGVYVRAATDADAGVLVVGVVDDSPAQRSGLRPGDVIVAVDGRPVEHVNGFRLQIASGAAGRELPLAVQRGDHRDVVAVRLEEARDVR